MASIQRDSGQFALLLIDVQRDFWGEKTVESFPQFPENISNLLDLCRTQGVEIFHLRSSPSR